MDLETQKGEKDSENSVEEVQSNEREAKAPSGEAEKNGAKAAAETKKEECVIEVKRDGRSSGVGGGLRAKKVCRICHLGSEISSENSELIRLGCGCKEELGVSHLRCAEA
ncbi:hypothetical protein U1Q18_011164 [Sarracenia purpurea var. burkii]